MSVGVAPHAHAPAPPSTTLGPPPGWPRRELFGEARKRQKPGGLALHDPEADQRLADWVCSAA
jgi:hypothetical protein